MLKEQQIIYVNYIQCLENELQLNDFENEICRVEYFEMKSENLNL